MDMNRTLVDVALKRDGGNCSRFSEKKSKDLEEIVMGDVEERSKERERYLDEKFENFLNNLFKD